MSTERFALAVAQPRVAPPSNARTNVDHAVELVTQASARGAGLVVFPEHYPGPSRENEEYDAAPAMTDAARINDIGVCWSRMERCGDGWWRLVVYVLDRNGEQLLRHERTHPATVPQEETGGWVAPGEVLGEFVLDGVPMGVVVCSELWIPETARVLALRGAEVLLSPAGGNFTSLTSNWIAIARARAIENQCYVALTNNLYGAESGAAMIAGPEHVPARAGRAELVVADLDLARVRWLRTHDDALATVKPFDAIPGLLRARRPELYGELAALQLDAYDYRTPPTTPLATVPGAGAEGAGA